MKKQINIPVSGLSNDEIDQLQTIATKSTLPVSFLGRHAFRKLFKELHDSQHTSPDIDTFKFHENEHSVTVSLDTHTNSELNKISKSSGYPRNAILRMGVQYLIQDVRKTGRICFEIWRREE